jgi:transcriptional regulator with XRE-family HTH domain
MPLRARFGRYVRSLRQERLLTQELLAERSELSVDAVRRIERGYMSPTLDTLRKLTSGLEISLHTLFKKFDDEHPSHVAEVCDYLTRRNEHEVRLAWRVLRALFDGEPAP